MAFTNLPHPEEAAKRLSRRTHGCRSSSFSAPQLAGQPQHLAAFLLAIGGQRAIAAGGIDRDRAEQILEPVGAREVEAEIGAARQFRHLLEGGRGDRVASLM